MRKLVLTLIGFSLAAGPAAFAGATQNGKDSEDKICKRQAKTGTRFASKICYTKAQWEEITEANKRAAAENFNKPTISTEKGN
jgi:hypothetical protein